MAAVTSDTVHLSWTVAQGVFESFLDQYRDVQGQPQAVPVGGELRKVNISSLVPARKYKFLLLNSKMQKDTAYCPWTQRPVNEGQRPPSPLEPFDGHSSPLVTVGILFSVLHTPDPSLQTHLVTRSSESQS